MTRLYIRASFVKFILKQGKKKVANINYETFILWSILSYRPNEENFFLLP